MENISNVDLSYMAGILDGEGCIEIIKSNPKEHKISPNYKCRIRVSNCDKILINWLYSKFGGYRGNQRDGRNNRRNQFYWGANDDLAAEILRRTIQYMVIKKEQSKLLIEMRDTFKMYYGIFGVPSEVNIKRDEIFTRCRLLKHIEYEPYNSKFELGKTNIKSRKISIKQNTGEREQR